MIKRFMGEEQNPCYGVNIIKNSNLSDGTNGWFPLGSCVLKVLTGSPHLLPPAAPHEPRSGRCIHITDRTQTWMGPAQMIRDKVKLYVTWCSRAWKKVCSPSTLGGLGIGSLQASNLAMLTKWWCQWVSGSPVEMINDTESWHEICGSCRIEKQAAKVMVYIQGPAAGISFMVAGLQIFTVDPQARFKHLKRN
ncbi:glycosyl hydrolase family 10 protein / carbohydrate-binding domain-containing protein [Artemisia annua]|uniref:Glycosyl hydrolase family 10 protein / carbohydrate-binding domain-containing protein n=1 Tax=Artemisia annua TaxID=35608 RepID=A0A2U1QMX5_ARTAN|nr:glycosyl hydrolase family 10 protein / carbohydrate-binding domain-containing protein [Artemisia annua]